MAKAFLKNYLKNFKKFPSNISMNPKSSQSFILSLIKLCTITPLISLFTLLSISWVVYNAFLKKNVLIQLKRIYQSESQENYTFDNFLTFSRVLLTDAALKSVIYYLKPTISYFFTQMLERTLFIHSLALPYECFFALGPSLLAWKITRLTISIVQSYHLFVFDVVGSVLSISTYIYNLKLEFHILFTYVLILAFYLSFILFLSLKLKKIKKDSITIDDQRASDMKDLFSNLALTRLTMTDEHKRLDNFFVSDAILKYSIYSKALTSLFKVQFLQIVIYFPLLFLNRKDNFFEFFVSSFMIMSSLNRIAECLIELEGKRVELEDVNLIQDRKNNLTNRSYRDEDDEVFGSTEKFLVDNGFRLVDYTGSFSNIDTDKSASSQLIDHKDQKNTHNCDSEVNQTNCLENEEERVNSCATDYASIINEGKPDCLDSDYLDSYYLNTYDNIAFQNFNRYKSFIDFTNLAISLSNVNVTINQIEILKKVYLNICKADKIALFGENGSGKSTFLRFLLGLVKGTGNIEVYGKPQSKVDLNATYLPQNNFLYRSVMDELMPFFETAEMIVEECKRFGIHEYLCNQEKGYKTSVLDIPMSIRQVLSVIITLRKPADFLLADEPQSHQDKKSQLFILEELLTSPSFTSKIICIHDRNMLSSFDKVFLFSHGTIYVYEKSKN